MITEDQLEAMDGLDSLAVSAFEGRILSRLVQNLRPKVILEIGTGNSYSSAWMALAMDPSTELYTIDKVKRNRFEDLPIHYFVGDTSDMMDKIPANIDLLFLDSDHTIDVVQKDTERFTSRIPDGGVVAVHDTIYCDEMGRCLQDYFEGKDSDRLKRVDVKPSRERWDYKGLRTRYGLGIATKLGAKK